ncbi:MAG TPA: polysaccharide pyruvyl transferase family protein [Solirubrobacteraceae bacterium]|jgi:polysaccharide pyruvyl transferase WcaK-like protein
MSSDCNKGDYAILSATAGALREEAPGAVITAVSAELPHTALDRPADTRLTRALGCEIVGTPVPSLRAFAGGRGRWVLNLIRAELLLWARRIVGDRALMLVSSEDREFFRTLADADVVVAKGGSYLHSLGGLGEVIYLWRMLYPLRIAHAYRRKTVLLGVSFGERYSLLTKAMLRTALRSRVQIYAREPLSLAFARSELGIVEEDLQLIPDLAFLTAEEISERPADDQLRIGVTVRCSRFTDASPALALERYKQTLEHVLGDILRADPRARVIFIPQVLEDIPLARDIAAALGCHDRVEAFDADLSLEELLALYAGLDVLVGTRLHSIVLAAVTGIPFVHIVVERSKSNGTLEMLGMESAGVPYDGITDGDLMRAVQHALANRDEISGRLRVRVDEHRRALKRVLTTSLEPIAVASRSDGERVDLARAA